MGEKKEVMGHKYGKLVLPKTSEPKRCTITAINDTMSLLVKLTQDLPVGTNLALLQFLWMLVSGALLPHLGSFSGRGLANGGHTEAMGRSDKRSPRLAGSPA